MVAPETAGRWLDDHRSELAQAGITAVVQPPSPAPRALRSVAFQFESNLGTGQLTVWDSGAAELVLALWSGSADPVVADLTITGPAEFRRAVQTVTRILGHAGG
jgi:hypothetical protein